MRSRYAEDRLADAARAGVVQYVILGAGLDMFAYRSPLAAQVQTFEVDQPAAQRRKRQLLSRAGITPPGTVTFVAVDLEAGRLVESLVRAGFDRGAPAAISWLGVSMYLTRPAIDRTLAELGLCAPGSSLVMDYMLPAGMRGADGDTYVQLVTPGAAQQGEPWRTFLAPEELSAHLSDHGFGPSRHLRQREAIGAALWRRTDALRPIELSMLAHATVGVAG